MDDIMTGRYFARYDSENNTAHLRDDIRMTINTAKLFEPAEEGEDFNLYYWEEDNLVEIEDRDRNEMRLYDVTPEQAVILFATLLGMKEAAA